MVMRLLASNIYIYIYIALNALRCLASKWSKCRVVLIVVLEVIFLVLHRVLGMSTSGYGVVLQWASNGIERNGSGLFWLKFNLTFRAIMDMVQRWWLKSL